MPDKTYTIAKCVDTVIVLRKPLTDFAVWQDEPQTSLTESDDDISTHGDPDSDDAQSSSNLEPIISEQANDLGGIAAISLAETIDGDVSLFGSGMDLCKETSLSGGQPLPAPEDGIHYLCSSAHLKQSSEVFKNELSRYWMESIPRNDGRYYIIVEGWDEDALLILLNILHLQHKGVPKEIDLEKLTKVAVLVDYYQCHEAVDLYHPLWIKKFLGSKRPGKRKRLPSGYGRDAVMWLCVACVFKQIHVFSRIIQIFVHDKRSTCFPTLGLPIRDVVSDRNTEARNEVLDCMTAHPIEEIESFTNLCVSRGVEGMDKYEKCRDGFINKTHADLALHGIDLRADRPLDGVSPKEVQAIFRQLDSTFANTHTCHHRRETSHLCLGYHTLDHSYLSLFDCYSEFQLEEYRALADGWDHERDI